MHFTSVLCMLCACIVHCPCCLRFSDQHTASQHVFPCREMRNRRCAKQHKSRKIHAQNTQIWLDYWFYYVVGVDLQRESCFINVSSAFLRSFQRQFACFVSHAYSRDVTPVGYGGRGG